MFDVLSVTSELDGRLAVIEFDHGKANEVGSDVLRDLERLPTFFRESGAVAAITFSKRASRKGTPIFVAGANVAERTGWNDARVKEHVAWQRSVLGGLQRAPVFHVAVVGGVALGWGTEYMLCCDWRIAASTASFGLPETGLGIVPGAGGSADLWSHIGVAQTLRLGMTGERIGADEACRIGLIQEVVDTVDAGLERARGLAARVSRNSPTAMAAFKAAVLDSVGQPPAVRRQREAEAYEVCVDHGEAAVGRAAFAAIRAGERPDWALRKEG